MAKMLSQAELEKVASALNAAEDWVVNARTSARFHDDSVGVTFCDKAVEEIQKVQGFLHAGRTWWDIK